MGKWREVVKQVEAVKTHNKALRNQAKAKAVIALGSVGTMRSYNGQWVRT